MSTFAIKAVKYFTNLDSTSKLPSGVKILNPYKKEEVKSAVRLFFKKFYNDNRKRIFILGINPGRFGGGLTGITFTDPVALREHCGIENNLGNKKELSSKFIYHLAMKFGGTENFYSKIFLTALYPFALIKNGKNFNYYDDKSLANILRNDIIKNIDAQIAFGARRDFAIILGKKNAEYFTSMNEEKNFFDKIVVLEHPRFIMQYRQKFFNQYIDKYLNSINQ